MFTDDEEERSYQIRGLTELQSGIVFAVLATVIILFVGYQISVGRVFTKSGDIPLGDGLSYGFLMIETVAAVVGFVRGVKMIQR